jgi:hypothetical protein
MVELVLVYIGVKLSELIVHLSGIGVVLDIEVAVTEETEGSSVTGRELQFVVEDTNNLVKVMLIK